MPENTVTLTLAFNWKLSVLGLLMLPLLLRLGFWQLERAEEKQQLNSVIAQQHQLPPVTKINQHLGADLQYRKIQLQGYFDQQRYWLLDNKTRQGRVGYEVIVPFVDSSGATILINRGWLAAPPLRSEIPIVDLAKGMRRIEGYAYQPSNNVMTGNALAESVVRDTEWPRRIQKVDIVDLY
ncbi:MAG: SURF1 family protein, partial [Pseudomonadota bacterium]|nr:SURF1 family protein [Pseudomonadota bacterium]